MTIKIEPVHFNKENCCNLETEWFTPRILSQEATKEILGDNLSSLIAIGVDGKPILFLPHGTEIPTGEPHPHSEVATLLNYSIKIPVTEQPFFEKSYTVCYPAGGKPPRPCPC